MNDLTPLRGLPGHYVNADGMVVTATGEPSAINHLDPAAIKRYTRKRLKPWQANLLAALLTPVLIVAIALGTLGVGIWVAVGMSFPITKTVITGGNIWSHFRRDQDLHQ